jgi:tetraacyldisaccharide 4'-kinase
MSRLLWPLAGAFRCGVALRTAAYHRGWLQARRLHRPVISVGNITVGGTGKTPLVAWMAEALLRHGYRPSILTRGYGRTRQRDPLVIDPAADRKPDPRHAGDEPALLARWLPEVPIVVAADRYRAGLLAEDRFGVDVHLLDDGFQHWALARDLDVVLLDATQPLSDDALLPAGRQREPCAALRRAQIVIVTRTELAPPDPLEKLACSLNPRALIVRARTRLAGVRELAGGGSPAGADYRNLPVFAFCGTGHPHAFLADLKLWGFRVAGHAAFRDHHRYTGRELGQLMAQARAAAARALVTTEKDICNFPPVNEIAASQEEQMAILVCHAPVDVHEAPVLEQALLAVLPR